MRTARPLLRLCLILTSVLVIPALLNAQEPVGPVFKGTRTVVTTTRLPGAVEPQVAVSPKGTVYVAFGAGDTVYVSRSGNGGASYDAPVAVASAGKLSLGMRRGPRIVATSQGAVVTATYSTKGNGEDGDLLSWHTVDRGKTWQGPTRVNDVPGSGREGLHAMTVAPDRTIACAWLDLREKGTQIFASFSRDGGKSWSRNVRVYRSPDGTVCECCHPSLAYDAHNRLYVMWRNWLGGSRDMYLSSTSDSGKTFTPARKLGTGTWPLNACPMDGGGLAVSERAGATTFWRCDDTLYLATAPYARERRVATGQQGWAAATKAGLYLVWQGGRAGSPLQALTPGSPTPVTLADSVVDPAVAAGTGLRSPVVAVWSDKEGIRSAVLSPLQIRNR